MNRLNLEQIYNLLNDYLIDLNRINNYKTVDFLELRYNAVQIFLKGNRLQPKEYDYINNPRFYNLFFNYITDDRIQCLNGIKDMNPIEVLKYLLGRNFPKKSLNYYGKPVKKLGEGVNGEVYDYGNYAVKILKRKPNKTFARMLNEVLPIKYVKSSYILEPLDVIIDDNVNIVMDKAKYDLHSYIYSNDYNVNDIPRIAFSILNGMIHYFNMNMVNRDLKPENVLIFNNGEVKIADLGLSYPEFCPIKYNEIAGTTPFISLNLLLGDQQYGPNVDIWSFGCILAELYLREGLFKGPFTKDMYSYGFRIILFLGIPTSNQIPLLPLLLKEQPPLEKKFNDFIKTCGANYEGLGLPTDKLNNPLLSDLLYTIFDYNNFHINNNYDLIFKVYNHKYFDSVRSSFTKNCIVTNCEESLLLNQSKLNNFSSIRSKEILSIDFNDYHYYYRKLYPYKHFVSIQTEVFMKIKYILDFYVNKKGKPLRYYTLILVSMNLTISSMGYLSVDINQLLNINRKPYNENFYLGIEKEVIETLNWNLNFVTSFTIFKSVNQRQILKDLGSFTDSQTFQNEVETLAYYTMFTTMWYDYLPSEQLEIIYSILKSTYVNKDLNYAINATIGREEDIVDAMKQYLNIEEKYINYGRNNFNSIKKGIEMLLRYNGKLI